MTRQLLPWTVAFLLPLTLSAAAQADAPAEPACTAAVAPGGELAPWTSPQPLAAGGDARRLPALAVGQAAEVTLLPTLDVRYPLRPAKPGGSVSYGGLIGVDVPQNGTYRVALGTAAWIDLVRNGAAVASVAHGHGPDCTGVRKMVDFPLSAGRYVLQIGANGTPKITVLVARLP